MVIIVNGAVCYVGKGLREGSSEFSSQGKKPSSVFLTVSVKDGC